MISADLKANIKQQLKLEALSYNFLTWNKMQSRYVFSI